MGLCIVYPCNPDQIWGKKWFHAAFLWITRLENIRSESCLSAFCGKTHSVCRCDRPRKAPSAMKLTRLFPMWSSSSRLRPTKLDSSSRDSWLDDRLLRDRQTVGWLVCLFDRCINNLELTWRSEKANALRETEKKRKLKQHSAGQRIFRFYYVVTTVFIMVAKIFLCGCYGSLDGCFCWLRCQMVAMMCQVIARVFTGGC